MSQTIPVGTRVTYGPGFDHIQPKPRGVVVEPTPEEASYLRTWVLPGVAVEWELNSIAVDPSLRELEYANDLVLIDASPKPPTPIQKLRELAEDLQSDSWRITAADAARRLTTLLDELERS